MRTPEQELFERLQSVGAKKETAPTAGSVAEKVLEKTDQEFKTPVSLRNLFTHYDTHPVVLDLALIKEFGIEWFNWEPETIWASIHDRFQTNVSEHNRAKIQAVQTLHVVLSPWNLWQVFEKVVQALNNNIPRFDVMQAPSVEQLFVGVDIMDTVRREPFSQEVKSYMAACVLNDDVFFVPEPLDFIQVEISQPHYKCMDCGQKYSALFHDGVCDTCTQKFDSEQGLSMRPKPELLQAGLGKHMELSLKYDPDPVQRKWDEVSHKLADEAVLEENQTDIQVTKLLLARDFMNIRRRQLAEQLVSLKSWLGAT